MPSILIRWRLHMAAIRIFGVHRTWEDWIGIIVGALIVISPWMVNAFDSQFVVMHTGMVTVLVLSLAGMEIVVLQTSEEWVELACGLWLTASPFIFGDADPLQPWHSGRCAIVAGLAVCELRQ